jgi:hypothetical protein
MFYGDVVFLITQKYNGCFTMMSLQLEDPDPDLNSDPELPGSVKHNYESGSYIRKCSRQLDPDESWKFFRRQ